MALSDYYAIWNTHKAAMRQFMVDVLPIGSEVYEDNSDDYGYGCSIKSPNGSSLGVQFHLVDSGDGDDGIYNQHGNFHFLVEKEGGVPLASIVPYNYTDEVWVDYPDFEEWETRLKWMQGWRDEIKEAIQEWVAAAG